MSTIGSWSRDGKVGALAILCLCAFLIATSSPAGTSVDNDTVFSCLNDIVADFDRQRSVLLPIVIPDPAYGLDQSSSGGIVAFVPRGFPRSFLDGLTPENDGPIPIYAITVYEDPVSRIRMILNGDGKGIAGIRAPANYDPTEYVRAHFPSAIWNAEQFAKLKAIYDPARIVIHYQLIEKKNVAKYLAQVAAEQEQAVASAALAKAAGGDIGIMMAYNGAPVSDIQFTAIERTNAYVKTTVAYPGGYTNRLEFFACDNLIDFWWTPLAVTNVSSTTNWIEWVDTDTNATVRFYAAGNADLDSDSDLLTDAREKYLYHTSASTNDTDGDGRSDYQECIVLRTDPRNSDIVKPTLTIDCPSNNYTWVWLP